MRQRLHHAGGRDLGDARPACSSSVEERRTRCAAPDTPCSAGTPGRPRRAPAWKPGSTPVSCAKLRSSSVAPTSSTIDSADFGDEQRVAHPPAAGAARRASAFLEDVGRAPRGRRAMRAPARRAGRSAATRRRRTRTRSRRSTMSATRGMLPALSVLNRRDRDIREQQAERAAGDRRGRGSRRASAAPGAVAPAPSAARIAISFSRTDARTSSRLATFAHAISTTTPTAASSVRSAGRTVADDVARAAARSPADSFALCSGYCCARRSAIVFISVPACSSDDAGLQPGDDAEECPPRGGVRRIEARSASRTPSVRDGK